MSLRGGLQSDVAISLFQGCRRLPQSLRSFVMTIKYYKKILNLLYG